MMFAAGALAGALLLSACSPSPFEQTARDVFGEDVRSVRVRAETWAVQVSLRVGPLDFDQRDSYRLLSELIDQTQEERDVYVDVFVRERDGSHTVHGVVWFADDAILETYGGEASDDEWLDSSELLVGGYVRNVSPDEIRAIGQGSLPLPRYHPVG